jgi:uncharacterized protein DUF4157
VTGSRARVPQQKGEARPVAKPHDRHEHEADRTGDVVARGGSVAGWSFTKVPATPVQRQEVAKPKSDDDKKKEALEKAGEAALETPQGKAIKDKVLADPLVKTVKDAVTSTPGMIGTGLAAAGGVAALGAAKKPLPFQPPAIPLDKVTPGLSAQVRLDGPVNAPTFVGLTLTYKEQGPKGKPTAKSDEIAKETAALRAQQDMFKPASQKLAEQKDADDMVQAYIRSQRFTLPLTPGVKQEDVPKNEDSKKDEPKKDEDKPVQRAPASASAASPAHANVDGALATPGRPLDPSARHAMEARFGRDFSSVRVHDDARAGATAKSIDAAAFTVGEDVVFAPGRFDTSSAEGRRLLAHELAHVVQQRSAGRPLDARHRAFFEPRLDADLGAVRIHTDAAAAASASDVKARAYTLGRHVVFGRGHYAPDTPRGRWLLAHELAHVAQGADTAAADGTRAVERDASDAATDAARGRKTRVRARRNANALNLFGEPDHVPDLTFVSTSGEQGFLSQAVQFHSTWGLNPQRFNSMQGLLATLAQSTTAISRLRIVSHANFDNIFTPLFDGGSAGITEDDLRSYAESDVAGLRHTLGAPLIANTTFRDQVVDAARTANAAALTPFGLQNPGSTATGAIGQLVDASVDLLAVRTATGRIPAQQRRALDDAITTELAGLRTQVQQATPGGAGVTAQQALDLQNAITSVTGFTFTLGAQPGALIQGVQAATGGLAQNFRSNLTAVRARLSSSSWIDIRGCRVGQHPTYLAAVAQFFGTGQARPHVSGPDLFQSYPRLGFQTVNDATVRRQAANTDVQTALDHWADVTGIRERLNWWLRVLATILFQESQRIAAERQEQQRNPLLPPSLSGGLQLRTDPFLAFDVPGAPLPTLPELGPPTLTRPRPTSRFGAGTLRNPLVEMAQREVPLYTAPDGLLRYYLDAGLPLPVQQAANLENIFLLVKAGHERDAIDAWLNSEWEPAAPGLPALHGGRWDRNELRQVEAVSDLTPDRSRVLAMFVSPDPRYDQHIQRT